MAKPRAPAFQPYVLESRIDMSRTLYVVVGRSFNAVRAVYAGIAMAGVYYGIYDTTILDAHLPDGPRPRYAPSERPLQSVLQGLVSAMRERGGSPEAVVLLSNLAAINEEDIEMAKAKLENKGETAPKTETKAATKGGAKKGGNPEALAKAAEAREGKRADTAAQKVTLIVKAKDSGLRGGRLAKLEFVEKAKPKTVGDVLGQTFDFEGKEITIDMGALRGMEKREHISIG